MKNVLLLDTFAPLGVEMLRRQESLAVDARSGGLDEAGLKTEILEVDLLGVRSITKVSAGIFKLAKRLKAIGRAGSGVDNVDLVAATNHGVVVFNAPGANSNAVAEQVIGDLISLFRQIPKADASTKAGQWLKKELLGREVKGKTIGIIGLGNIGRLVAQKALGMDMTVIAFDPLVKSSDLPIKLVDNTGLIYSQADVVTLHLPANDETNNMICTPTIEQMKDGAVVINHARGSMVNLEDIIAALESDKLAGFIAGVFPEEPIDKKHPILKAPNTILSPHTASNSQEAQDECSTMIAQQFIDFLTRGKIANSVNFPTVDPDQDMSFPGNFRLMIIHQDVTGALCSILGPLAKGNINVSEQINRRKKKGGIAYTVIDTDELVPDKLINAIVRLDHVKRVHQLAL